MVNRSESVDWVRVTQSYLVVWYAFSLFGYSDLWGRVGPSGATPRGVVYWETSVAGRVKSVSITNQSGSNHC